MPELQAKGAETLWDCGAVGPELYSRLRRPRHADSLRQPATSQGRALYERPLAAAIVDAAGSFGNPLALEDPYLSPIRLGCAAIVKFSRPDGSYDAASTQGFALLAALAFVESRVRMIDATVHLLLETCRGRVRGS
jgi:gamma-glutamyltranspeptidase